MLARRRVMFANVLLFVRAGLWPFVVIGWGMLDPNARTLDNLLICWIGGLSLVAFAESTSVPRTWDEIALDEWATPVAGLNLRPSHFSPDEYYRAPVDNLRTYPVYYPGREPAGYWDMLQAVGPKPLIAPRNSVLLRVLPRSA